MTPRAQQALTLAALGVSGVLLAFTVVDHLRRGEPAPPAASAVAVGDAAPPRVTWKRDALPSGAPLRAISCGSDDAFVVGDRGVIARRANGEVSWSEERSGTTRGWLAVAQRGNDVLAAGDEVIGERAGGSWTVTPIAHVLRGAVFSWMGPTVVGDEGALLVRGPSGWRQEKVPTRASLRGVCAGLTETLAVGDHGTALRWSMGEWKAEPTHTEEDLLAITCDDRHAVAVGRRGVVIERKAGEWMVVNASGANLTAVAATFGMASWIAVGEKGVIVRSLGVESSSIDCDLWGVAEGPQGELAVGELGVFSRAR